MDDETESTDYTVRPFSGSDLDEVFALWDHSMPQERVDRQTFTEHVLLDPNFDRNGCLVAEQDGKLVGFILGFIRRTPLDIEPADSDRAWISLLFVHPNHRREGIGSELVRRVCDFAATNGRTEIFVSNYLPYYFFPGPDRERHAGAISMFESLGFDAAGQPVAMTGTLDEYTMPDEIRNRIAELEAEGIRIETITPEYIPGLIEMLRSDFDPDWARAVRDHLRTNDWDQLLVAVQEDAVLGWCQFGTTEPGRFGPYGVTPTRRGDGIGSALFHTCLKRMREKGRRSVWLQWTDPEGSAASVYRSLGMSISRRWQIMARDLKSI